MAIGLGSSRTWIMMAVQMDQVTGIQMVTAYSTARGINAEEIVVDGDSFVTPLTSKGPEELVPGQVLDTLDELKVEEE